MKEWRKSPAKIQVVDLKEQYMFPGFIEVHNTDILKAFENLYLAVDPVWDLDTVLEAVSGMQRKQTEKLYSVTATVSIFWLIMMIRKKYRNFLMKQSGKDLY